MVAYAWFITRDSYAEGGEDELSNNFIPTIIIGILGFVIATSCMGVYSMTVDSIMLCFCEDCSYNKKASAYMPQSLVNAIGKKREKNVAKEQAKEPPVSIPPPPNNGDAI